MAILVGVDEAGYGPILGPLVITATVFEVKDHEVDGNLWWILKEIITNSTSIRRKASPRPLTIADSKRLYSSAKGLQRLEEGVLAFQGCIKQTEDLVGLLGELHWHSEDQLGLYPWYLNIQMHLPTVTPMDELAKYSQLLKKACISQCVTFLGARMIAISPNEFNGALESCGNKSLLLFDNCAKLISSLWEEYPQMEVKCDKQGGRNRYAELLLKAFKGYKIDILSESPIISSYQVKNEAKRLKISFIQKAEDKHLPVALASMYSKYIRELFLKHFNQYWQGILPWLKSTAGYPKDARRFLKDIEAAKIALGIGDEILIRRR